MSTQTPLPRFEFGSTVGFDEVRDCIPPCLLALSAKGPELLGLAPPVVAIAGLAHLGASLGRTVCADDGCTHIPACFNLAIVSDNQLDDDWLSKLGKGWIDPADQIQTTDLKLAQKAIKNGVREIAAQRSEHEFSSNDPQFDAMQKAIPQSYMNLLRRRIILSKLDPGSVARALVESKDQCITLLQGAYDPMDEWASMPPGKQREMAEMLMLSWRCKHLRLPPHSAEVHASVHLLWTVRADTARRVLFSRRSPVAQNPLPVLLFRQSGTPKRIPDVCAKEFSNWTKCLETAFSYRFAPEGTPIFTMDPPTRKIAVEFFEQFAAALSNAPPSMHPHLNWLPDLVLRLYSIIVMAKIMDRYTALSVNVTAAQEPAPDTTNGRQLAMTQAVRLTRWLCQEHYQVVEGLMTRSPSALGFSGTDNTDTLDLAEAIFSKLQDQGPKTPRELQRCFHDLHAGDRDQAIAGLKRAGRVVENGAGQLEAAA